MVIIFDQKNIHEDEDKEGQIWIIENFIQFHNIKNKMLRIEINRLKYKLFYEKDEFKHSGIPGRKIKKNFQQEIFKLLDSIKDIYGIENIRYGQNLEDLMVFESKNINKAINNKFFNGIKEEGDFREYEDYYEYCIIKEYGKKFKDFYCYFIEIGDVLTRIIRNKGKIIIVSLEFLKNKFNIEEILLWIDKYNVVTIYTNKNFIEGCSSIIKAVKFYEKPIIFYEKGKERIFFDKSTLPEIKKQHVSPDYEENTSITKDIPVLEERYNIVYNGKKSSIVPKIEFDLLRGDIIISNGNLIAVDYIGDYCGCVGFYSKQNSILPIAFLQNNGATIYIDIYEREKQKIGIVESKYKINIEDLFYIK